MPDLLRVIPLFQKQGFNVVAAQLSLTSIDDDIAELTRDAEMARCARRTALTHKRNDMAFGDDDDFSAQYA